MSAVAVTLAVMFLPNNGVTMIVTVANWPLVMLLRSQLTGSVALQTPDGEYAETKRCAPVRVPVRVTWAVVGPLLITVAINRSLAPIAAGSGMCVSVT